jgi:YVTN family beta-propeller protein
MWNSDLDVFDEAGEQRPLPLQAAAAVIDHEFHSDDGTGLSVPAETVIATIPLGDRINDIVVGPEGKVYVAQSEFVTVLNRMNHITARIPVTGDLKQLMLTADGSRLYAIHYDGSASIISTADHSAKAVSGGWNSAVALGHDGRYLYGARNGLAQGVPYSAVSVVDPQGTTVAAVLVVDDVTGLALGRGGTRLYAISSRRSSVYQYSPGWLTTIDTTHPAVIDTIAVGANPQTITCSPDGAHLYITYDGIRTLSDVDLTTNTMTAIALDDVPLSATFTPDGTRAYLNNSGSLSVVDTTTREVEPLLTGGSPRDVQINADGKRAYIAKWDDRAIWVVDTITSSVIHAVAVSGYPTAVAAGLSGERLYVGDYWSGAVTVIAMPSVRDQHRADSGDTSFTT